MRDLFGSTKYIKFGVLETILNSSNAVNDLFELEGQENIEGDYTFIDYISNLDSYLYGLIQLPPENKIRLKLWINNYIKYLYIPLVEKDCIYIVKSRFMGEMGKVKKPNTKIDKSIQEICNEIIEFTLTQIEKEKTKIENKLITILEEENIIEYLINYYNIYNDKEFIKKIYYENEKLKEIKNKFEFLTN